MSNGVACQACVIAAQNVTPIRWSLIFNELKLNAIKNDQSERNVTAATTVRLRHPAPSVQ